MKPEAMKGSQMKDTVGNVDSLPRAEVRIAGVAVASEFEPVRDPARTDEVVGEVALGTVDHVDEAVSAALVAFASWSKMAPHDRAKLLQAAAEDIAAETEDIAHLLTREQGKPVPESRIDVGGAAHILNYYADLAGSLDVETVFRDDERGTIYQGRRPAGVTGVIVPWNSPIYLAFLGIAPALMAGNTVVVKPSEFAPLALARALELLASRLPVGVVSSVPGRAEAGAAIARHRSVRKLFFTGSTATGQAVMRDAADNLKNISLELGGNDPALVLDSAVITEAMIDELVKGVFATSGQICFAVKRIYVHESHYENFLSRFVAAVDRINIGPGSDERTTMGPLNNRPQYDRVQALLDRARAEGATIRALGQRLDPDTWDQGLFVQPTVVTDMLPEAEIVTCEQFGPIIPIVPFSTVDDVVAYANATEFGLSASIWSADHEHALEVARRLECGSVFINAHRIGASDVSMPFGGFKMSGLGRGHGITALEGCLETQMIADYRDTSHFPPLANFDKETESGRS